MEGRKRIEIYCVGKSWTRATVRWAEKLDKWKKGGREEGLVDGSGSGDVVGWVDGWREKCGRGRRL